MSASLGSGSRLAARYADWLDRHRAGIVLTSLALVVIGAMFAARLPLRSDLSSLLPPSKQSVKDLDALRLRARSFGNVLIMLEAPTPEARATAGAVLEARLRALPSGLISAVSTNDGAVPRFIWTHRFLFVELSELRAARDVLVDRIAQARLHANPLFIDLDEGDAPSTPPSDRIGDLTRRLDEAEAKAAAAPLRLSPDQTAQLFVLQVTFPSSNITAGRTVMGQLRRLAAEVMAQHEGVDIEFAGTVNISIFEHDSVISGMALAAGVTILLCFGALVLYYRAVFAVGAVLWSLLVGVAVTLAFTKLVIGHLNLMSAFLAAIVVGNGVNTGLLVLARYFEEVRSGKAPLGAIGPALAGAAPGTLAAALTAAVAYGSLIATDFRGFRHFGIIGAVGMVTCWLAAYTVLPAALSILARRGLVRPGPPPRIGLWLARLLPRRMGVILLGSSLLIAGAVAVTGRYIASNPFAKDWRVLGSDGPSIVAQQAINQRMNARFDRNTLSGHSFQLVIAVDRREQVGPIVSRLRALEEQRPADQKLFTEIRSIEDLVPPDQDRKLALLAEVRALLEDDAIAQLSPEEQAPLEKLRPPGGLRTISEADVPSEIGWPFVEQDGSVGRLIYVKGSLRFRTWNVDDRLEFADAVHQIELPAGAVVAGEPLVIADIVESMHDDAPWMVILALVGSILAVWLVVGRRRHGVVTLICGLAGVILMIALCAIVDLPVHFLDLIALPITIGIGIDYSVNLVARDREEGDRGPHYLLATTGGAVLLCSYTTAVGYGSLLLSTNGGIRAFGLAALLGEIACLVMALLLAPALLAVWRPRKA